MKNFLADAGFLVLIGLGFVAAFVAFLLFIGIFIKGDHIEITPAGDGCYTVTKYHTNWYPSKDEILSRDLICEDK